MYDDAKRIFDERNPDILALTANDMEAEALVALARTVVDKNEVARIAKETIASAGQADDGKRIFKQQLQALLREKGGA
jgi:hypothetical protein